MASGMFIAVFKICFDANTVIVTFSVTMQEYRGKKWHVNARTI